MSGYLNGKGFWIWILNPIQIREIVSNEDIVKTAVQSGFKHLIVKFADAARPYNVFNGVDLASELIQMAKKAGLIVYGYQYIYLGQGGRGTPVEEARMAKERMLDTGADGFVIDAEGECKAAGKGAAADYMAELRSGWNGKPIALSSYRFPSLHQDFPWNPFVKGFLNLKTLLYVDGVDFLIPQVYLVGATNSAYQLQRCLTEYEKYFPGKEVIPTGSAYQENGWKSSPESIVEFAKATRTMGLSGYSFWEWANSMRYGLFDTVANLETTIPVNPDPKPAPNNLKVKVSNLNFRKGPGLSYESTTKLPKGFVATPIETKIVGADLWVKIQMEGWVCAKQNGHTLAEVT